MNKSMLLSLFESSHALNSKHMQLLWLLQGGWVNHAFLLLAAGSFPKMHGLSDMSWNLISVELSPINLFVLHFAYLSANHQIFKTAVQYMFERSLGFKAFES